MAWLDGKVREIRTKLEVLEGEVEMLDMNIERWREDLRYEERREARREERRGETWEERERTWAERDRRWEDYRLGELYRAEEEGDDGEAIFEPWYRAR